MNENGCQRRVYLWSGSDAGVDEEASHPRPDGGC